MTDTKRDTAASPNGSALSDLLGPCLSTDSGGGLTQSEAAGLLALRLRFRNRHWRHDERHAPH